MANPVAMILYILFSAILLMPVIGGLGYALIDRWWKNKLEYEVKRSEAQAEAFKCMAENLRNANRS